MKNLSKNDFLDLNGDFDFWSFKSFLHEEVNKAYSTCYNSLADSDLPNSSLPRINFYTFDYIFIPLHFLKNLGINIIHCDDMEELDNLLLQSYRFLTYEYSFKNDYIHKNIEFENFFYSFFAFLFHFDLENAKRIYDAYVFVKDCELQS